jgi:hypothetical protein
MAHFEDSSPENRRVKQTSFAKIEKTIQLLLNERQQVAVTTATHDDDFFTAIKDICVQATESLLDPGNIDDPMMGRIFTLYQDTVTAIPSLLTGKWHANSDSSNSYPHVIIHPLPTAGWRLTPSWLTSASHPSTTFSGSWKVSLMRWEAYDDSMITSSTHLSPSA